MAHIDDYVDMLKTSHLNDESVTMTSWQARDLAEQIIALSSPGICVQFVIDDSDETVSCQLPQVPAADDIIKLDEKTYRAKRLARTWQLKSDDGRWRALVVRQRLELLQVQTALDTSDAP